MTTPSGDPKKLESSKDEEAKTFASLTAEVTQVLKKLFISFIFMMTLGTIWGYYFGYESPFDFGFLVGVGSLGVIWVILKVRDHYRTVAFIFNQAFSNVGGYIGAVVVPIIQVYLHEEEPRELLSQYPMSIFVICITALAGGFFGSIYYAVIKNTSTRNAILGGLAFNCFWILSRGVDLMQVNLLLVNQIIMLFLSGALIAGLLEFAYEYIKSLPEKDDSE